MRRARILLPLVLVLPLTFGSRGPTAQSAEPLDNDELVAGSEFEGFPDKDSHSGVFCDVIAAGSSSLVQPAQYRIVVNGGQPTVRVAIFDGNSAGLWDQNSRNNDASGNPIPDGSIVEYDLAADGLGAPAFPASLTPFALGDSEGPGARAGAFVFTNAIDSRWQFLFEGAHPAAARLANGDYQYLLTVRYRVPVAGAINGFKVAANGAVGQAPRGNQTQIGGFIGGVVDSRNLKFNFPGAPVGGAELSVSRDHYPDVLEPNAAINALQAGSTAFNPAVRFPASDPWVNKFTGMFDLRIRLVPPPGQSFAQYLSTLILEEGDADDVNDLTGTGPDGLPSPSNGGIPPDDGRVYTDLAGVVHDNSGYRLPVSATPQDSGSPWLELIDPNGVVRVTLFDLSGNVAQEDATGSSFERVPVPTDGVPGDWTLRMHNWDARNSWFVRSNALVRSGGQALCGRVFLDLDRDTTDDLDTDPGIPSTTVTATRIDVAGGATLTTTTDGTGAYCFADIPFGTWRVTTPLPQVPLTGLDRTTTQPIDVPVAPLAQVNDVDMGYTTNQCLAGRVFLDLDRDTTDDGNTDPGINLVSVSIVRTDVPGGLPVLVPTDPTGAWRYCPPTPGTYQISVPPGQAPLASLQPTTAQPLIVVLPAGSTTGDLDLGYAPLPSSLAGRVFRDLDRDQSDDGNTDPGIQGILVSIQRTDIPGVPAIVVASGFDGAWSVAPIDPGTYQVRVAPPVQAGLAGLAPTTPQPLVVVVPPSTDVTDADLGYAPTQSVRGRVFRDLDRDTTDDGDTDPGIGGVDVTLTRTDIPGVPPIVVQSNATGAWQVDPIDAGTWRISIAPGQLPLNGLNPTTPQPLDVVIVPGAAITDQDLGYTTRQTISGRVFRDLDRDTTDDGNTDPGIAGVTVTVRRTDVAGEPDLTVVSGPNGEWVIDLASPGTYSTQILGAQAPLAGLFPTTVAPLSVVVPAGSAITDQDLGYTTRQSIAGRVFRDLDRDTTDDGNTDPGIAGVTVTVRRTDVAGEPDLTVVSGPNGEWVIDLASPGTYSTQILGAQAPLAGLFPTTVAPLSVVVPAGSAITDQDLGYTTRQSIAGRVFRDLDRDTTDDGNTDPGIAGVTVTVRRTDVAGEPDLTVVSGPNGEWVIDLASPGTYSTQILGAQAPLAGLFPTTVAPLSVVVPAGSAITDQDLGYATRQSIRGVVFREANGRDCDGVRQADEAGIEGVTVSITGTLPIRPTIDDVTDANGAFSFDDLLEGTYSVQVGGGQPVLVNLSPSTPVSVEVNLPPGETRDVLFGFCPPGRVRGVVFREANGRTCDGVRQADESGIEGVAVSIVGTAPVRPAVAGVTNANGEFAFENLPEGVYEVRVAGGQPVLVTLTPSTPLELPATVLPGTTSDVAFGFCPPARIRGVVFREANGRTCDGVRQADESDIEGVTVSLVGTSPVRPPVLDVTDSSGAFEFPSLPEGTYAVSVAGGQPVLVTLTASTALSVPATLLPGDDRAVDFGFCPPGQVRGVVFREANGRSCDGVRQADESGVEGVTVSLVGTSPVRPPALDVTDSSGAFEFPNLPEGTYAVSVAGGQPVLVTLSPSTPLELPAAVLPGTTTDVAFGFCPPARIRGVVFREANGRSCDGVRQADESGIEGVLVGIDGLSPVRPPAVTLTGPDGSFEFAGLAEGVWRVQVGGGQPVLVTLTPSTSLLVPVPLLPGDDRVVDFGFCPPARIRGVVFREANGRSCDGVRQADESGIEGVLVGIDGLSPVRPPAVTLTGPDGSFEFAGLAEGVWRVQVGDGQPVLVTLTPSTSLLVPVPLLPGDDRVVDFGFCPPARIRGVVFREANGRSCDGVRQADESGIENVTVTLTPTNPAGPASTRSTGANGAFEFAGLAEGAYEVRVAGGQPVLVNLTPSTALDFPVTVLPGTTREVAFGFCPPQECGCDEDRRLHEVTFEGSVWMADPYTNDFDVYVRLDRAASACCQGDIQDLVTYSYSGAFPGAKTGANGILRVTDVRVVDGYVKVTVVVTANAPQLPRGTFDGPFRIEVTVNCVGEAACGNFTCDSIVVDGMFPKDWKPLWCDDLPDFRVVNRLAYACWQDKPCTVGCVKPAAWWLDVNKYGRCDATRIPWPAPADEDTSAITGRPWLSLLLVDPSTNGWTALARQAIAARLNGYAGACLPPEAAKALDAAIRLLVANPTGFGGNANLEAQAASLRAVLTLYNDGRLGPKACGTPIPCCPPPPPTCEPTPTGEPTPVVCEPKPKPKKKLARPIATR